jgi:beta-galactosidase
MIPSVSLPLQFPYGSVYFRKSNPPRESWEQDYSRAAEDGVTAFRHWFIWGSTEIAPGVYDWDDYDRQFELAEKHRIKLIVAEITTSVPAWAAARYPELLPLDRYRRTVYPEMGVSCATGGFSTGFCPDHAAAREMTAQFLCALAGRYKNHPALLGYDVANEGYLHRDICYCPDTLKEYRQWLKKKYGDIQTLNRIWKSYSYTDFSEISPQQNPAFFPDSADWLSFRRERHHDYIRWKIGILREADPASFMTAHGMAATFSMFSENCCDDWAAAAGVDVYGVTWVQSRKGNEPWKQFFAMDLTRSAARGKPFWHTEAQGGPLWLQPQLRGRTREDGRISSAEDVRIWSLISMAAGARGIFYTRHRPLLDGPLFGAFAPYDADGGRTERSVMASIMAKWANDAAQETLFAARPVSGEIGILFIPEAETASYLLSQYGNEHCYASLMQGAYRGFFGSHIQADFVHIDFLDDADTLYLPYPAAMTGEHARKLAAWVEKGGVLICESCPGYFGDAFHVGETQPNNGLDRVFGVKQRRVEFAPDLTAGMEAELLGQPVRCGGYLQTYELLTAEAAGFYGDEIIAACNRYGAGKTLLIGASLSVEPEQKIFAELLSFAGKEPLLKITDSNVAARIHRHLDRCFLWLLNPSAQRRKVKVSFPCPVKTGTVHWRGGSILAEGDKTLEAVLEPFDGIISETINPQGFR